MLQNKMEEKTWVHSGTPNPRISGRELAHSRLARELAADGIVLLKNEGVLPLKASAAAAVRKKQ